MLDLENLNYKERESYQKWVEKSKLGQLSVGDLKEEMLKLIFSATRELVEIENNQDEKNTHLKARVKNYLLMYDILVTPDVIAKRISEVEKKLEDRMKP
jgi:hypothetical protein